MNERNMQYPTITKNKVPNFPTPLSETRYSGNMVFPSDLINGSSRKFYTHIEFVNYSPSFQFNNWSSYSVPSGGMKLPIPLKLDDNLILQWSPVSFTNAALGSFPAGVQLAIQAGSIGLGQALNPLMFLQFQRPEFRQFSLSWLLTPSDKQESETIKNIIISCKKAASPKKNIFLMGYPKIALIKMYPNDIFGNLKFKPCVITSVQVNYTSSPIPSFHKNGAPAFVALTLNLMEMQFWFENEIN